MLRFPTQTRPLTQAVGISVTNRTGCFHPVPLILQPNQLYLFFYYLFTYFAALRLSSSLWSHDTRIGQQIAVTMIAAVICLETVMHVFIASAGVFVTCMFPIHQFLYLFSTSHGLFSIPLRHTRNLSLPKTSSGKCSNRTGCSLPF